ncbi:MAG TPA: sugar phosphate nucleotidyltransferase [Ignavibacteria bacterium]|nr:sugar phosphate nucleotidyltransferase [Ignavibacteria bacterium]
MKIVIPVAGFGSRLRPHTLLHPKVLLKVAHKPMIYFIVNQIIKENISDHIIFIIGYLGDDIKDYILKEFGTNNKIKFEFITQETPKGLGHAIYTSKPAFKSDKENDVFIILGDTLFDVDLKSMINSNKSVIGIKKVDDPRRFGVVEKNEKGIITKFIEKPISKDVSESDEAIVGLYYIKNSNILFEAIEFLFKNEIKTNNEYQLTDALSKMLTKGEEMLTYSIEGWLDCGKHNTILETNSYILNKYHLNNIYQFQNTKITKPIFIAKNVEIENSEIGENVSIHENCKIKNSKITNSIIESNCEISGCEITNSIIGVNSKLKNFKGELSIGDFSEVKVD